MQERNKSQTSNMKQTQANIATAILFHLTASICSLILPRYILLYFGSDVNGMLQSINQLLTYTVLMEFGAGGLIVASFYKPLAENNQEAVSDIFNNTKKFFGKISLVYIGLVALLAVGANVIIKSDFDYWYVSLMVVILGANNYFSYYFAFSHRLLLRADQKIRIIQIVQSITIILNLIVCIITIMLGAGIHIVKAVSALVFLINPVVFRIYVKKHYNISNKVFDNEREIPRKTDGFIHHIAFFIHMNTDIVLLSVFNGTKEVSVYSVYNAIIFAVENFFSAISDSIAAALGRLIARDEKENLSAGFELYQTVNTAAATFVCVAEAVLIIPFVHIYTSGISDVNYIRHTFAYIMIAAQWFYCVRMPYNNIINAAGHYRQTKAGAFIEVALNLIISIICVSRWGLVGVAVGTAVAMAARMIYMVWYLSKNILYRSPAIFVKDTVANICLGLALVFILNATIKIHAQSLVSWAMYAFLICIIIAIVILLVNVKSIAVIIDAFKKNH